MKQTKKISQSGSFINYLMSNNESVPTLNEWATICLYSDRKVCKVTDISKDGKTITIEHYTTIGSGKNLEMGHQEWEHKPSGHFDTLVYRQGAWRKVSESIEFDNSWYKEYEKSGERFDDYVNRMGLDLWDAETGKLKLIDGVSKNKKTYSIINVLFGVCDYYYDWSF